MTECAIRDRVVVLPHMEYQFLFITEPTISLIYYLLMSVAQTYLALIVHPI